MRDEPLPACFLNPVRNVRLRHGVKERRGESGTSIVEIAVVLPLLVFIILGVFDLGFLFYAGIGVQNAARVAAIDTSASIAKTASTTLACADAAAELAMMPNHSSFSSSCNSSPLQVSAATVVASDGTTASLVTVAYSSIQLIPLPWMTGKLTITRTAEMRARN
jgi:Flp pilus assembly protein TadG